jgi:hypothetical protein
MYHRATVLPFKTPAIDPSSPIKSFPLPNFRLSQD